MCKQLRHSLIAFHGGHLVCSARLSLHLSVIEFIYNNCARLCITKVSLFPSPNEIRRDHNLCLMFIFARARARLNIFVFFQFFPHQYRFYTSQIFIEYLSYELLTMKHSSFLILYLPKSYYRLETDTE